MSSLLIYGDHWDHSYLTFLQSSLLYTDIWAEWVYVLAALLTSHIDNSDLCFFKKHKNQVTDFQSNPVKTYKYAEIEIDFISAETSNTN